MAGFSLKDCREYDEWQFFQAEKLRGKLTNTLVRLSAHYANALEYETAIGYARRWLALDPLQEAAHRQLMSLFSQSGQRAAALRQYENCRQMLSDELGVEPSEETKELYQKIQASTLLSGGVFSPQEQPASPINALHRARSRVGRDPGKTETGRLPAADAAGSRRQRQDPPGDRGGGGLLDDFKHGVFFVNLAPLEDAERIPSTIAAALNFSFYEGGTPRRATA